MDAAARMIIVAGIALALTGAVLWIAARSGLGRLPGDIFVQRDGFTLAVPIVTSIIASIVLTIVLNVVIRLR